jgi:copper-binding protein NosD
MRLIAFTLAIGGACMSGFATAATLHVANNGLETAACGAQDPCRTISRAINLAMPGDTILVRPGRYGDVNRNGAYDGLNEETGGLTSANSAGVLVNKPLTILSTQGADATIIDMGGITESAVRISADNVRFGDRNKGFTLTGGQNFGLAAQGTNVFVTGNTATGQTFAGFYLVSAGIMEARANTALDNPGTGFLAVSYNRGDPVIVAGNTARANQVGISTGSISAHRITGNKVINNEFAMAINYGDSRIVNNYVSGNRYGISVNGYSVEPQNRAPQIVRNNFSGNLANSVAIYPGPEGVAVTIRENNFLGTDGFGVANLTQGTVNARHNFWGASTGPGYLDPADEAGANVLTTPFATSEFPIP